MDRDEVLKLVESEIESLANNKIEDYDMEIFSSGFLDSLNIIHIITFLENEFSISIDPFDINLDSVGTLNKIVDFVLSK